MSKNAQLIQRQIAMWIDAICPVGTTGESATLTDEPQDVSKCS